MSTSLQTCKCKQGTCVNCGKYVRCSCSCASLIRRSSRKEALEIKAYEHDDSETDDEVQVEVNEVEETSPRKRKRSRSKRNRIRPAKRRKPQTASDKISKQAASPSPAKSPSKHKVKEVMKKIQNAPDIDKAFGLGRKELKHLGMHRSNKAMMGLLK